LHKQQGRAFFAHNTKEFADEFQEFLIARTLVSQNTKPSKKLIRKEASKNGALKETSTCCSFSAAL